MMYGRLTVNPIHAAWNTVARFDDYGSAQRAVDRLSDDGFPVEQLDIVGSDLQLVERVTGRLTKWRAAAAGALSGMWAGLLIGILFGLFTTGHAWLAIVAAGIGLGVLWGAIFGFVAHLATRGGALRPDRARRRRRAGPGRAGAGRIAPRRGRRGPADLTRARVIRRGRG
jgi:hypothetical protein